MLRDLFLFLRDLRVRSYLGFGTNECLTDRTSEFSMIYKQLRELLPMNSSRAPGNRSKITDDSRSRSPEVQLRKLSMRF